MDVLIVPLAATDLGLTGHCSDEALAESKSI